MPLLSQNDPPRHTSADEPAVSAAQQALEHAIKTETGGAAAYLSASLEAVNAAASVEEQAPHIGCRARLELGNAQRTAGELGDALVTIEAALETAKDIPGQRGQALMALAFHRSAIVYATMGTFSAALERLRASLDHYREAGDTTGGSRVENTLGIVYSSSGDYEQALSHFQRSLQVAEAGDDRERMSSILTNISISTRLAGLVDDAIEAARRSLSLAGDLSNRASCTTNLATALAAAGRLEEAEAAFVEGTALHQNHADPALLANHLCCHAEALAKTGRVDEALPLLRRALGIAEEMNALTHLQQAHRALFELMKTRGDHAAALHHHEAFHEVSKRLDMDAAARELQHQKWQYQVERARREAETERRLRERLAASYAELTEIHRSLSVQAAELQHRSRSDGLTGLANRQHFDQVLAQEGQRARATGEELGLLLLDLDDFKSVNDRYGHPVGDKVLRQVAELLRSSVRHTDLCARLGGEEFGVLLVHTGPGGVSEVAQKARSRIAEYPWQALAAGLQVTTSAGGALLSETRDQHTETLMAMSDARLYRAKRDGRNRVVISDDGSGT